MYEPFYLLHDCFDPAAPNGISRKIAPDLVRSIERYCSKSHDLDPIDRESITNTVKVRAHFEDWCGRVQARRHGIETEGIIDTFAAHLLAQLQQSPSDPMIRWHWLAFLQQRCAIVSRQVWQMVRESDRSIELFEEFVSHSYSSIANLNEVQLVFAKFRANESQYVSGLNHIKAYLDRRIRYSLQPYARQSIADPNLGLSDLGVAARYSHSKVRSALTYFHPIDRVEDLMVLWGWFDRYRRETGIHANRLNADDFSQIGSHYQRSYPNSTSLTWVEVRQRLVEIGGEIRTYQSQRSYSLDAQIAGERESTAGGILRGETNIGIQCDFLQSLAARQIVRRANHELTMLLNEPTVKPTPSPQQLFWLYYGLRLTQQQIGTLVHLNFGLNTSPGSISLRLTKSHRYLFDRIHTALQNEPPQRTHQEINAAMGELLKAYFQAQIPHLLRNRLARLGMPSPSRLSDAYRAKVVAALVNSLAQKIDLQIPNDSISVNLDCFFQDS